MNSSYAYVYDDFLTHPQFERDLTLIEQRLNTHGLAGRVGRLTMFRSPREVVEGLVQQGVRTIIVVGNDQTMYKLTGFLPSLNVVVGYIPMEESSFIADLLRIPRGLPACEIIAARLIEALDMGRIQDRYFLTSIELPATGVLLDVERIYRISLTVRGTISIRNLGGCIGERVFAADARDGRLEALLMPHSNDASAALRPMTKVLFRHGELRAENTVEVLVDGQRFSMRHVDLAVVPAALRCIVGRGQTHRLAKDDRE